MPQLTLDKLPGGELERVRVDLPEFGTVDDEPYFVYVRGLTAYEFGLLIRLTWRIEGFSDDGSLRRVKDLSHDEICMVAAMCSVNEDGKQTFGKNLDDAVEIVKALPRKYREALVRIHEQAMNLSSLNIGADEAVEDAEKN